jgi:hypothetical protein
VMLYLVSVGQRRSLQPIFYVRPAPSGRIAAAAQRLGKAHSEKQAGDAKAALKAEIRLSASAK